MSKSGGCSPYAGKISNSGTQVVKAPVAPVKSGGKSIVKTGDDLRVGKKNLS